MKWNNYGNIEPGRTVLRVVACVPAIKVDNLGRDFLRKSQGRSEDRSTLLQPRPLRLPARFLHS